MSGFKAMNERPESGAPFRLGNVRNQGGENPERIAPPMFRNYRSTP
jgi:hypothetical protein